MFIYEEVFDWMIAELFEVSISKVRYKRKKYNIDLLSFNIEQTLSNKELNNDSKKRLLSVDNINMISKALTHFSFRNGPIEDMHARNDELTEENMKILNKFMVNRLAYVFGLIIEERWSELEFLIRTINSWYGSQWDEAIPDDGGNIKILKMSFKEGLAKE